MNTYVSEWTNMLNILHICLITETSQTSFSLHKWLLGFYKFKLFFKKHSVKKRYLYNFSTKKKMVWRVLTASALFHFSLWWAWFWECWQKLEARACWDGISRRTTQEVIKPLSPPSVFQSSLPLLGNVTGNSLKKQKYNIQCPISSITKESMEV